MSEIDTLIGVAVASSGVTFGLIAAFWIVWNEATSYADRQVTEARRELESDIRSLRREVDR